MAIVGLLVFYCSLTVVASLAGGWLPFFLRLTHRRMQIAISFVSGMILGIGLLHLLPHSISALASVDRAVAWMMGGFLFMFFLERFFRFHHHDAPDDEVATGCALGDHVHADVPAEHGHAHAPSKDQPEFTLAGAAIGLTLHSIVDGIALAAAVQAEAEHATATLAGLGTCLAIALHKPFDSLTIGTLMATSDQPRPLRHVFNILYSLVTPLGVLLFYAFALHGTANTSLGQALGFAAGAFVCIATSDLLPELQFHRHDRLVLSAALIGGILLAWSTVFLETTGHDHDPAAQTTEAHDHDHGETHPHDHDEH